MITYNRCFCISYFVLLPIVACEAGTPVEHVSQSASTAGAAAVAHNTEASPVSASATQASTMTPSAAPPATGNAAASLQAPIPTSPSPSGSQPAGKPVVPAIPPERPSTDAAPSTPAELKPKVTVVLEGFGLDQPSDVEFNPYVEDELWVMNFGDSSAVIVSAASSEQPAAMRRLDVEGARHFMPSPTAFAFGARETTIVDAQNKPVEGTFATCPGVNQPYMGPTLWTSDMRIFGLAKSVREAPFNGPDTGLEGPGSHIDMLHSTPACTGIAWEGTGSIYWTYSGTENVFVRYDFAKDHGIGNADHSDASVWRYGVSGIRYVPNVPAHLAYAAESKLVYMADPGNSRVVSFDPQSASAPTSLSGLENLDGLRVAQSHSDGVLEEVVTPTAGLKLPTGIAVRGGELYVSDYETSKIHRFALDGTPLAEVVVEEAPDGGLTGLAFGPDGKLYFADAKGNRIFRLDAGL